MADIQYLPVWKKGATAEERFLELAQIARAHPERFARYIVLYEEQIPPDETCLRYITSGISLTESLGLLTYGQLKIMRDCSE